MFDYNRYLPMYLREVAELRALGDAADPPARWVYDYTVQKYLNQYIQWADAPTLAKWEKILRMSGAGLDLSERRRRIILRFCLRSPITVKTLRRLVEEFRGARCDILLDYPRYAMTLALHQPAPELDLLFLYHEIFTLKPANITFAMQEWTEQKSETAIHLGVVPSITARVCVPPGSAAGSRKNTGIKAGCCPVEYTRLEIRPFNGMTVRRRETRVAVALGRTEITQIKIPAYRGKCNGI